MSSVWVASALCAHLPSASPFVRPLELTMGGETSSEGTLLGFTTGGTGKLVVRSGLCRTAGTKGLIEAGEAVIFWAGSTWPHRGTATEHNGKQHGILKE